MCPDLVGAFCFLRLPPLQGLSGLFGVDSNFLGHTLGIPAELLNVRNNASRSNGGGFFFRARLRPRLHARRSSRRFFLIPPWSAEACSRFSPH